MASPNTRVVFDLVRDTNTIINLTPYFQGRVNDSEAPLPMAITMSGRKYDLTGKDVLFQGTDHEGHAFNVYGSADDINNGDSWHKGRVTMRFPAGVFQTPGEWSEAFFRIIDNKVDPEKSQSIISTLNVGLNVLDDGVTASVTRQAYHSRGETLVEQLEADAEQHRQEMENLSTNLKNEFPDLVSKQQEVKAMDEQLNETIKNKQVALLSDLGTNVLENDMGNLPTPATLIQDGFFKKHYGYCQLGDLGITAGKEISDTSLDDVCYIESIVLNSRVIQHAVITSADTVWEADRRSTGDTTWSDWVIDTKFYH